MNKKTAGWDQEMEYFEEQNNQYHGKESDKEGQKNKEENSKAQFCPFMVMRNKGGWSLYLDQQWEAEDRSFVGKHGGATKLRRKEKG